MKKLALFVLCFFINMGFIIASSGPLKTSSIVECGKTYGYHSEDSHYHEAIKKTNTWYAIGKNLGTTNPCIDNKQTTNINSNKIDVTFYKCVDGDTASFKLDNQIIKVRFLAIDTPETNHPTKGKESYGKEASKFTCNKLKSAEKIQLEYDPNSDKYDKYDRHLGWIFVDNQLLQKLIIKEGLAKVDYLYDDYKYTDILLSEEKQAANNKIGIWSGKEPKQNIWDLINDFIKKVFD